MGNATHFVESSHYTMLDGKKCTIRNLRPVFQDDGERKSTEKRIENELYHIFVKYMG